MLVLIRKLADTWLLGKLGLSFTFYQDHKKFESRSIKNCLEPPPATRQQPV